ncbi:MAG: acyltransferase [Sphingomonadales bacterium]|nr:acyltransferase [Sphingomonadales bacterium]
MNAVALLRRIAWPTDAGAFRLWLALVVVVHHLTLVELGKAPVLAFFFLSGFWVQRVWTERYARARQPWLTFVVSRWWRIAPLLLLATPPSLAMLWLTRDADWPLALSTPWRQALLPFSVVGYAQLPTRPAGPAWSLDIEMQFYLAVPLLALLVRRLRAVAVLALGFLVFEASLMDGLGVVLPSFLPWFLLGMVAAEKRWRPSPAMAHGSLALVLALVAAVLAVPALRASYLAPHAPEYASFNLLLGALILPFALGTVTGARRADRVDAMLADQSFLVYMLHWPAIIAFRHLPLASPVAAVVAATLLMGVVVVVSALVWRHVDRPLNRLRKRWVDARIATPDRPCAAPLAISPAAR